MSETTDPLMPRIPEGDFTEFQHRLERRTDGELGRFDGEGTVMAFDMPRDELFSRLETFVGHTPLIHLEDVNGSAILAKVESQNPTENHYDRVFPRTIKKLEEDGVIRPGDELVEVTSGSGGRAFAFAARVLGYRARLKIPPELPMARRLDMVNLGAVLEVSEPGYMAAASKAYVDEMTRFKEEGLLVRHKTPDYNVFTAEKDGRRLCFVNHSGNAITVQGFETIGDEIVEQMPEDVAIDFVVSVMGNGTSTTALSRSMRRHYPDVRIVGLEDEGSPHYFSMKYPGEYERRFGKEVVFRQHDMFGSSAPGVKLEYGTTDTVDEVRLSNSDERNAAKDKYNTGKRNYEKIGNSSAASLVVARQLAAENPGSTIVILFYDKADQYGEHPLIARNLWFRDFLKRVPEGAIKPPRQLRRAGSIALMPRTIRQAS